MLLIEKATEIAANTKETLIAAEKVAEEKVAAALDVLKGYIIFFFPRRKEIRVLNIYLIFLEKTNELTESAKQTAQDASNKAQELEKSAENKLAEAEKVGEEKVEAAKEYVAEKGSEALDATKSALSTSAEYVSEKASAAAEYVTETAVAAKDATVEAASNAAEAVKGKRFLLILKIYSKLIK